MQPGQRPLLPGLAENALQHVHMPSQHLGSSAGLPNSVGAFQASFSAAYPNCLHLPTPNKPTGVKLVLEAVCILKGVKAIRFKDPQSGQMVDSFWEAAKKMLMEDDFLASLRNYDKDHIDPAIVKKIQTYVPQPDFQPETVQKVGGPGRGGKGWDMGT